MQRMPDGARSSPRQTLDEMWTELVTRVARVQNRWIRQLLEHVMTKHGERLRTWPAAVTVHHTYPSGLLEHILMVADVAGAVAAAYDVDGDLVFAGAVLHDLGKVAELQRDASGLTSYSREGNLLGHVVIGFLMVREAASAIAGFPEELRTRLEHLVVAHHGARQLGAPVEPMTEEAFILSAVDDLDAKLYQLREHAAADAGEGEFTQYHTRLRRVLLKPSGR
jgi:3'-5' exoribonuclease